MKKKQTVISPRFTMNSEEFQKWIQNILVFSAPAFLVFLTALAAGKPLNDAMYVLYLAIINTLVDFLKKWVPEKVV